jgi:hypothetical protein
MFCDLTLSDSKTIPKDRARKMSSSAPNEAASDDIHSVDLFLAAALRADTTLPTLPHSDLVPDRAHYHGVSALLASCPAVMNALPPQVQAPLRQQAIAETMWDLRHRKILVPLLRDLHSTEIKVVLLKETALAARNRANAQKSTGPRTAKGKARVPAGWRRCHLGCHTFSIFS